MASPLHQFEISTLLPLGEVANTPVGYTNSALFMSLAVAITLLFLTVSFRQMALIPNRFQAAAELYFKGLKEMLLSTVGKEALPYFPFILSIFSFILFGNLLGMLPFGFTFTSHIMVTFTLALIVFLSITGIGFYHHGLHFLSLFVPQGVPWYMALFLFPLEVLSYLARPISLALRLFANMMAGHILLKVILGFALTMGAVGWIVPVAAAVALTGFEIFVAGLQAFIFTLLSCLYLNDALNLH
jgi:F-type H+-transporting ATPase subunit a